MREIARAIESKDINRLTQLKGIGTRTARKIVATLEGKVSKFALIRKSEMPVVPEIEDITKPVLDVLTTQLGHKATDARRMVLEAMQRNPAITTPEQLFEEVYRGEKMA